MTVSVPSQLVYSSQGDGVTTEFTYPVRFEAASELVVISREDGVDTVLMLNTDYTVAGAGLDAGGTVTMLYTPTAAEQIVRYRDTAAKQIVNLADSTRNPAEAVENQLDRLAMVGQDNAERLSRAVLARPGSTGQTLPEPEADKIVMWNSAGDGLINRTVGEQNDLVPGVNVGDVLSTNNGSDFADPTAVPGNIGAMPVATYDPDSWGGRVFPFESRAAAEAATIPAPVQKISVIHNGQLLDYVRDAAGTALTTGDGATWSPAGKATFYHWGVAGDGIVDDGAKIKAACDYAADAGVTIYPSVGIFMSNSQVFIKSYTHIEGVDGFSIFMPGPDMALSDDFFQNETTPSGGVRVDSDITIRWCTFDGINRNYPEWLENPITGERITDPEADYSSPGVLDVAQYPGQTIQEVIDANRRNPAAVDNSGSLINFMGVNRPIIEGCTFKNHGSFPLRVSGSLFPVIKNNYSEKNGRVAFSSGAFLVGDRGSAYVITGITKANPCVVTVVPSHGFEAGETFEIRGVNGMIQIPDGTYTATAVTSTTITLADADGTPIDSTGYSTFVFNGRGLVRTIGFIHSEDAIIKDNRFYDLDRHPIQISGLRAKVTGNKARKVRESGIYMNRAIDAVVTGNEIDTVLISDLVANGVEMNYCVGCRVEDNDLSRLDTGGIISVGGFDCQTDGNRIFRAGSRGAVNYQYGPFSERYAFSAGSPIIAGTDTDPNERVPLKRFAVSGFPSSGSISRNIVRDDRTSPWNNAAIVLSKTGVGSDNGIRDMCIEGNDLTAWPTSNAADLIDYGPNVIDPQTVTVRNNKRHPSQSAFVSKRIDFAAGVTGVQLLECGFPPSAVKILTFSVSAAYPVTIGHFAMAKTHANQATGSADAKGVAMAWGAAAGYTDDAPTAIGEIMGPTASTRWFAKFDSWADTGVNIDINIATDGANLMVEFYP